MLWSQLKLGECKINVLLYNTSVAQFNLLPYFCVLHQQPNGQLQIQINNNYLLFILIILFFIIFTIIIFKKVWKQYQDNIQ
jgi:hypothetical protein